MAHSTVVTDEQKKQMIAAAALVKSLLTDHKIIGAERLAENVMRVDMASPGQTGIYPQKNVTSVTISWEIDAHAKNLAKDQVAGDEYQLHKALLDHMLAEYEDQLGHKLHPETKKWAAKNPEKVIKTLADNEEIQLDPIKDTGIIFTVSPKSSSVPYVGKHNAGTALDYNAPVKITCPICYQDGPSAEVRKHIMQSHGVRLKTAGKIGPDYECVKNGCGYTGMSFAVVRMHSEQKHGLHLDLEKNAWLLASNDVPPTFYQSHVGLNGEPVYKCQTCSDKSKTSYATANLSMAWKHYNGHQPYPPKGFVQSGNYSVECVACAATMAEGTPVDILNAHAESHVKEVDPLKLSVVNGFKSTGVFSMSCNICGWSLGKYWGDKAKKHLTDEHGWSNQWTGSSTNEVFEKDGTGCHICGKVSLTMADMVAHAESHKEITCKVTATMDGISKSCNFSANTIGELNEHIQQVHWTTEPEPPVFDLKLTPDGKIDYFKPATAAYSNGKVKEPKKPKAVTVVISKAKGEYFCTDCQVSIENDLKYVDQHIANQHGPDEVIVGGQEGIYHKPTTWTPNDGVWICQLCKVTFKDQPSVMIHLTKTHLEVSATSYAHLSAAKGYVEVTDMLGKHYKCLWPGCDKSFGTPEDAQVHSWTEHTFGIKKSFTTMKEEGTTGTFTGGSLAAIKDFLQAPTVTPTTWTVGQNNNVVIDKNYIKGKEAVFPHSEQMTAWLKKLNSVAMHGGKYTFEWEPGKASRVVRTSGTGHRIAHAFVEDNGDVKVVLSWQNPATKISFNLADQKSFEMCDDNGTYLLA